MNYYPYKSDKPDKKYYIITSTGKKVYFGASDYQDFTQHKNEERKNRYIQRHKNNERWNDPTTAGFFSRWITWNKKTLKESIQDTNNKFKNINIKFKSI